MHSDIGYTDTIIDNAIQNPDSGQLPSFYSSFASFHLLFRKARLVTEFNLCYEYI